MYCSDANHSRRQTSIQLRSVRKDTGEDYTCLPEGLDIGDSQCSKDGNEGIVVQVVQCLCHFYVQCARVHH